MLLVVENTYQAKEYKQMTNTTPIIMGVSMALSIGMLFFNLWQWYLALIGVPQIEFMQNKVSRAAQMISSLEAHQSYGCANYMDNLHISFGTRNIFRMLLAWDCPRPLNGLEWTCFKIQHEQLLGRVVRQDPEEIPLAQNQEEDESSSDDSEERVRIELQ